MEQKKRLAILIEVDSFIGDIYKHLSHEYEILAIRPQNPDDVRKAVQWADVVWFEFCNELFLHVLNQNIKALGKRVIVRWHRFEIVESTFPQRMRFDYIDDLILVSHDMRRVLQNRVPDIERKTRVHVLWNGLNLEKFRPISTLDPKKIAWAAKPFLRKNQPMFLQIMHELVKRDSSYTLHVAGVQEEFVTMPYLARTVEKLGLSQNVFFHGWQSDMPAFLADKGVILSTSIHESFGYNIAEAMATGALPVVHDYPGAEEFWPDAIRFSSISEAVELVLAGKTHQWIDYVHEKFPLSRQLSELDAILAGREKQPEQKEYLIPAPVKAGAPQPVVRPVPPVAAPAPAQVPPTAVSRDIDDNDDSDVKPAVRRTPVFDSSGYWEDRYRTGGNSGAGSYNQVAQYKALVINLFARKKGLRSFAEMGSGDGNQLGYFEFENYTGFDVSNTIVAKTRAMYADKPNYQFIWTEDPALDWEQHEDAYDCALSLDVLYHLIDDDIYVDYLDRLFSLSNRYVVIYASNFDSPDKLGAAHVKHRKFVDFIARRYPQWNLLKLASNPFKFKLPTEADFAIYGQDENDDVSFLRHLEQIPE